MEATQRTKKQKVKSQRKESEKRQILREWEECGFKSQLIADKYKLHRSTLRIWYAQFSTAQVVELSPSRDVAQRALDSRLMAEVVQIDLLTAKEQLAVEGAREMIRRMANTNVLHTIKDKDIISLIKLAGSEVGVRNPTALDALEHSIQRMRETDGRKERMSREAEDISAE